jgi:hypothetical protein
MKQRSSKTLALAALVMFLSQPLRAEVLEGTKTVAGTTVHHKTVLPNGYDPAKAYPAILAFGGGPQTMNTVDNILNRNFRAEAEKRGYLVFAPAAPGGEVFFESGARIFPEFLKMIMGDYKIQGSKFHVAGPSAILPVRHGFPRIHVETKRSEASGDREDVRFHVRRRARPLHVAQRDGEGGRVPSLQGNSRTL